MQPESSFPDVELMVDDKRLLIGMANSLQLRQQAYELMHQLYVESGVINPQPSKMWLSIFDGLEDTATIIFKDNDEVIATGTLIFDSPFGLPLESSFKAETDKIRTQSIKLVECISLGINKRFHNTNLIYHLIHALVLFADQVENCSDFIVTTHKKHSFFYKRALCCTEIGEARAYDKVNNAPTAVMHFTPQQVEENIRAKRDLGPALAPNSPFFKLAFSDIEKRKLADHFKATRNSMSDAEKDYFFVEKTDIWAQATDSQRLYLEKRSKIA